MSGICDLYIRGFKGLSVLEAICDAGLSSKVGHVFVDGEENVEYDFKSDIVSLAHKHALSFSDRSGKGVDGNTDWALAAGWRFLIKRPKLLVLHDSLLPKYRGFNPLVSMLINGEREIGASLIHADSEVDRGDIICQKSTRISYPIKIQVAMSYIGKIYAEIAVELFGRLERGDALIGIQQEHTEATYSLWRDEDDYLVDWKKSAGDIKRFIDAVGYPYKGATAWLNERRVRINDAEVVPSVRIENPTIGKVFHIDDGRPVVVCGEGLLRLNSMVSDEFNEDMVPFRFLKSRFTGR